MLNKLLPKIVPKQVKGYSLGIHLSVIFLSIFGLVMVLSANGGINMTSADLLLIFIKESIFTVVSYLLMVHVSRLFNFKVVKKLVVPLMGITTIMNIVPLFFRDVGGAHAWIRLPGITIQPSEFTKVVMILVLAAYLADRAERKETKWYEIAGLPLLFVLINVVIITVLQKDLGSAAVISFMTIIVLLIPQNKNLNKLQAWVLVLFIIGFTGVILLSTPGGVAFLKQVGLKLGMKEYMFARFQTVSDPFYDILGRGYHVFNGFISFTSGGLIGKGLGSSLGKHGFVPEARTDFILAIIVEELGMFGLLVILVFYGIILYSLIKNALAMKYDRDKMILLGTAAYLMVHFLFNVGGITALIPLTGVPLLLISSGASSKISFLIAIGIAQSTIAKAPRRQVR